jgi:ERCC4-type nuclease
MTSTAPSDLTIVIDSREQRGFGFSSRVAGSVRKALPAGDYSVVGYETALAVERKSMDDFVNTVIHAHGRFARELQALASYRFAWIVVEGSLDELLRGAYTSRAHPASLLGLTATIMTRYGVPVLFAHDRPCARALTEALLCAGVARLVREKESQP